MREYPSPTQKQTLLRHELRRGGKGPTPADLERLRLAQIKRAGRNREAD